MESLPTRVISRGLPLALVLWLVWGSLSSGYGHPQPLDAYGGHDGPTREGGEYHYHRPPRDLAQRKAPYLRWTIPQRQGELRGRFIAMASPRAIWLRLPFPPVYHELAALVARGDRRAPEAALRIDLAHVDPRLSARAALGAEAGYAERIAQAVETQLRQAPDLQVRFTVLDGGRLRGLAYQEGQLINLWMVQSGWSFFFLDEPPAPRAPSDAFPEALRKRFHDAEQAARTQRLGLWSPSAR